MARIDRNRARVRARLNILADLGDSSRLASSLASGDVNDPTSTNQTLGVFYTRKAFALDQAYVNYEPSWFKPLTLTAGKFRYPWYNTELTWDKDLNPEGAAQTLAFNLENTPVLKRIAVVGFELPFAEEAGTGVTNKNIVQSMAYGTQLQTNLAIRLAPTVQCVHRILRFPERRHDIRKPWPRQVPRTRRLRGRDRSPCAPAIHRRTRSPRRLPRTSSPSTAKRIRPASRTS